MKTEIQIVVRQRDESGKIVGEAATRLVVVESGATLAQRKHAVSRLAIHAEHVVAPQIRTQEVPAPIDEN